ncbi:MAG: type II CAAX endopeptidase family protein [Ignavibacteria bacterium]|nr:type II CAAX endopeptidase family protein [Ignavibacteria bacterium]
MSYRKKVITSILLILLILTVEFSISLINGFLIGYFDVNDSEYLDVLTDLFIICISLCVIYFFSKRLDIKIPITRISNYRHFFYASIFFFMVIIFNDIIEDVILNLFPFLSSLEVLNYSEEEISIHSIVFLGIFYPLVEELSFRCILFKIVREEKSFVFSASTVSLLFFLVHPIPQAFILFFGMSFLLCYLYENYNSLVPPLIFHSVYNILVLLSWMYAK